MTRFATVALLAAAIVLAGCNSGGAGDITTDTANAAPKQGKQGGVSAAAGELQPAPGAPTADQIVGSKAGGR